MVDLFDDWLLKKFKGMRVGIVFVLILCGFRGVSQENLVDKMNYFYDHLNQGDSTEVSNYMHKGARVKHLSKEGVWDLSIPEFLEVIPKFRSNYFSEKVLDIDVHSMNTGFIYVDCYFDFYVEGNYSFSGVDHFCWTFRDGELKIESVYSSNFDKGFSAEKEKKKQIERLDQLMLDWHDHAATANLEAYFGFMSTDFIYLGTDPSERWSKSQFLGFCEPYFERKSTWDFKTNWRNWYFSTDGNTAWFEESLATWMEECRGSGVLKKINGEWRIAHYNLAVVIENEKIKKFIKLRKK